MSKKRKLSIAFLVIFIATFLTGCKGDEITKHKVTSKYQERIEEVKIINDGKEGVYVDFDVKLIDENKEIIYIEKFEGEYISDSDYYDVDLEDVKPDYISYDKVASMEAEIIKVYDSDYFWLIAVIIIFVILLVLFLFF